MWLPGRRRPGAECLELSGNHQTQCTRSTRGTVLEWYTSVCENCSCIVVGILLYMYRSMYRSRLLTTSCTHSFNK